MKSIPLAFKFAFLAVLIAIFGLSLWLYPLKKGIDLEGGHSLIFKINTEGTSSTDLPEQAIEILKRRVDPRGLMNLEWRPVGLDRIEVRMPVGSQDARNKKQLYLQAIDNLEKRNLKPSDVRQIVGLPEQARGKLIQEKVGDDTDRAALLRQIGQLSDQMIQAEKQVQDLNKQIAQSGGPASQPATSPATAPERPVTPQLQALMAQQQQAESEYLNIRADYLKAQDDIRKTNIRTSDLSSLLDQWVSKALAKQMPTDDVTTRNKTVEDGLAEYRKNFPRIAQKDGPLDDVVNRYKEWVTVRGRLDDPQDLIRLIRHAGVLEFRMAPRQAGGEGLNIGASTQDTYLRQLRDEGPQPGHARNDPYQWFKVRGTSEKYTGLVTGEWRGDAYLLLSNEGGRTMLRKKDSAKWALDDATRSSDAKGLPAVGFTFDDAGSSQFADLTGKNIGNLMAILLDDEVYSAPVIKSQISKSGIIEGNFTANDVSDLVNTFKSGSLPAKVDPNPVSVTSIGATLGQTNIDKGLRAAYISLLCVIVFMAIYYLMGGMVANFAAALNILFVLGAMALFSATFTMPGIAGMILTIGMSVDANVLIFERLREEQAKPQSLRMAFKHAYERAFTAILDGHLTTLLTSVILAWVGTTEVRGFAITLGMGVLFNLFTAVLVTRWVFEFLLESKILTNKLKMLRLIGVPKIDWMAKRHYFWAFSLVTAILGMVSLGIEGSNILGIEFRSGSHAVIRFNDDALLKGNMPNDEAVAKAITDIPEMAGLAVQVNVLRDENRFDDFVASYDAKENGGEGKGVVTRGDWLRKGRNADYFTRLDSNGDGQLERSELQAKLPPLRYEITTAQSNQTVVRNVIDKAFPNLLNVQSKVDYTLLENGAAITSLNLQAGPGGITRITASLANSARSDQEALRDHVNGVLMAFQVKDNAQSMTAADVQERLKSARLQPDRTNLPVVDAPRVLPLTPVPGTDRFTAFAVLIRSDDIPANDAGIWDTFARNELSVMDDALKTERSLESLSNFDPAMTATTSKLAVVAVVLSWLGIIVFLWFRFGSAKWGIAAVVCLVHDTIIMVGLVAVSGWMYDTFLGKWLMLDAFKIDMTMIAAILTVIGYSVNDTIVVFDRIRENRGRLTSVSANMINQSINQTISRTLLTSFSVFLVVFVMYVWGGDGIHGFNFALLAGVLFGTYSSIAVAAPILLVGTKKAIVNKIVGSAAQSAAK